MGHHHRHRHYTDNYNNDNSNDNHTYNTNQTNQQLQNNQPQGADMADVGSMLKNLNLGDIDLSKVDMNKVQSIMDKMQNQHLPSSNSANPAASLLSGATSGNTGMLEILKEIVPQRKAKKLDKLFKLMKLTEVIKTNPSFAGINRPPVPIPNQRKHR